MRSLGWQLTLTHGRPTGFDHIRITLAISVVAWHTVLVTQGLAGQTPFWTGPLRPLVLVIVPSFFALSGFLVAGSLERNDLASFLTLRALRIFPALAVEVLISALIIGPLLTTVSLSEYFSDLQFRAYFLNMIGDIHYILPGLFHGLPAPPLVNAQLWTVPFELECYVVIAALSLAGLHRWPRLLAGLLILSVIAATIFDFAWRHFPPMTAPPLGFLVVFSFLFGVSLHTLRGRIPHDVRLFALALALGWVGLRFPQAVYLAPPCVAYVTVFIGLLNPSRSFLLKGADYSYGIYLYGFPIQQTIAYLFPHSRVWYVNLPVALVISGLCAALSWCFVESKVLERKSSVLALVARMRGPGRSRLPVQA